MNTAELKIGKRYRITKAYIDHERALHGYALFDLGEVVKIIGIKSDVVTVHGDWQPSDIAVDEFDKFLEPVAEDK